MTLMDMDAVLLLDGVGIHRSIATVAVVLITDHKINFEEKISKLNLCKHLINSVYICFKFAMASSYFSNTL